MTCLGIVDTPRGSIFCRYRRCVYERSRNFTSGKRYDSEFKRESVRLADTSGKTDRQIERDLGLYQGAIRRWRDELEADPIDAFPGTGHQKPLEEENRCLRRELDIAREERDILNKVVAIFSKTPKADSGS